VEETWRARPGAAPSSVLGGVGVAFFGREESTIAQARHATRRRERRRQWTATPGRSTR